jgi:4-diphosphocytidyl-2-C-methyl-D-erythritol kinase
MLRISGASRFEFECSDATVPTDESNLVVRAVRAFERHTRKECRVRINLEKRIPHGAGLGGGSSDAAFTLMALDELYGTGLSPDEVRTLAAGIGSDVPAFLCRAPVICEGRGEVVRPAPGIPVHAIALIKPPFSISTPWAYSRWAESRVYADAPQAVQAFAGVEMFNDLERPVFEKHLFLPQVKRWLLNQPETGAALMSGSGSTMFAVLRSPQDAAELLERFRAEFGGSCWTWSGRTIPSPSEA